MKKIKNMIVLFVSCISLDKAFAAKNMELISDCPSSPNCVSSQSISASHQIEPLKFSGTLIEFHKTIQKIQSEIPRSEILHLEGPYAHLVVKSQIFRFKDDVEFYFLESESLIHVRSASRLGFSDLGVNRKRVEEMRKLILKKVGARKSPIIIGHRGASGYRPEHTLEAYQLAIEMGADFIEPDLVSTKDGVLIARHENEISATTDVALKFPLKKTTKVIDGTSVTGWFSEDLTLSEIKTLRAKERFKFRSQEFNGQFIIPTLEEILSLAKKEAQKRSRVIGIYPELKSPSYFLSQGLAVDKKLVQSLVAADLDLQVNPIFIQSFELSVLESLKAQAEHPLILLIGDLGQVPFDLKIASKKITYRQLLSDTSMVELKKYLAGIGLHKSQITSADLIGQAHRNNLLVHVYTFRSEPSFLDPQFQGQPEQEYLKYFKLGVDGVFTDFPDHAMKAKDAFLKDSQQ